MDCRKARYYLVTSFDGPLDPEAKRQLGYHLKDCRACRHESFYYRELFSAEQQLDLLKPSSDFNERLVAQIRLREAQAAWPRRAPQPARKRSWALYLAPGLFTAAAAIAFVFFVEPMQSHRHTRTPESAGSVGSLSSVETTPIAALPDGRIERSPRYPLGATSAMQIQNPQEIYRVRYQASPDAPGDDAFARLVKEALGSDYVLVLPNQRPQERTNYMLPVVRHGNSPEHVY
jgi:anti-sigma factor RsiW